MGEAYLALSHIVSMLEVLLCLTGFTLKNYRLFISNWHVMGYKFNMVGYKFHFEFLVCWKKLIKSITVVTPFPLLTQFQTLFTKGV